VKIRSIDVAALEYVVPKGGAYGNARGLNNRRSAALITMSTEDGVQGIGDAGGPPNIIREYINLLKPFFINQSIADFEHLAANARHRLYHFGSQGHFISALGGLDIAAHDARGKAFGIPVHELLGGRSSQQLGAYATTGYFTENPRDEIARQLSVLDLARFKGVKIKIGAGVTSDVARVKAAREIIGDAMLLMVDMNGNYTADVALESIRNIEPYNIHWCEEPLSPSNIRGYSEVRARSPVRIAAGEAHYGMHDFSRLIEAGGLDIVQPSVTNGGGFTEMKAVARFAAHKGIRISPVCWGSAVSLNATLHFAASLSAGPHTSNAPYPLLVEYDVADNPLRNDLTPSPAQPCNGEFETPAGPGLGIEIVSEIVRQYAV
jgi:D-galactarolactone cycloisomerase